MSEARDARRGLVSMGVGVAFALAACDAFRGEEVDREEASPPAPSQVGDAGPGGTLDGAVALPPPDAAVGLVGDAAPTGGEVFRLTFDTNSNDCARLKQVLSSTVEVRDGFCRICQSGSATTYGVYLEFEALPGGYILQARVRQAPALPAPAAFSVVLQPATAALPKPIPPGLPGDFTTIGVQSDSLSGASRAYLVGLLENGSGSCFDVDEVALTRAQ